MNLQEQINALEETRREWLYCRPRETCDWNAISRLLIDVTVELEHRRDHSEEYSANLERQNAAYQTRIAELEKELGELRGDHEFLLERLNEDFSVVICEHCKERPCDFVGNHEPNYCNDCQEKFAGIEKTEKFLRSIA